MMKKMRARRILTAALIGCALVGGSVAMAAPASAAAKGCQNAAWTPLDGYASATCWNMTSMKFTAHCDGWVGFPSWTKSSPAIAVGTGKSVIYKFPKCLSTGWIKAGPA
ncbi:hypothetical protein GCM10009706_16070 [Curtobacterium citreum]|nr:hypothetical protein FB462_1246 [Curtobacterium citreum]GGL78305.1 hypothetical protein GCM10009706_16070 [Curtobacterium citreum]